MSLHYFVPSEPKPEPVAEVLRQVAFPTDRRLPHRLEALLQRLGAR